VCAAMRLSEQEAMGADAAVQEQFGPYVVYERLGVGGMATVHRALERGIEGFERIVALKRLLPHLAADGSFIKSFVREAKLASLLNHINIVQIFELGRVGAEYFISMEYIDGRDVRRILRHARNASGPPPIHVTVGLLLQLCDALDYAHHKADDTGNPLGLVHRDVSPSNVLVTSAGQVKIIDFGIAKAQSSQLRTQTGRVKGKLAYMAPEALAGKDLDARSDLFAVGVIGHELVTARPLFATKNEYQTLMKVQRGDVVPPSTFNQGCPPELDAIVLRALARDPDERFGTAHDLREALHAFRKQYNLPASNRDIATWLEWAFSLEVPTGSFAISHTLDHPYDALDVRSSPEDRPPRPKHTRTEDDDAVDVAWGGGEEHMSGDPIVLDDVPDVGDKHRASASLLGADARLDLDDIPAPAPSHGVKIPPLASSRTTTASMRPPRPKQPVFAQPAHPSQAVPVRTALRSAQDDIATPNLGVGVGVRSVTIPQRIRTITIPPLGLSSSAAQRTVPSLSPPPPGTSAPPSHTPPPDASETPTPPHGVPSVTPPRGLSPTTPPSRSGSSTTPPPRRAPTAPPARPSRVTSSSSADGTPRSDTLATERTPALIRRAMSPRPDSLVTKRPPPLPLDDFSLPSDTVPSMPPVQHAEPIVRFQAPPAEKTPAPATKPAIPRRRSALRRVLVLLLVLALAGAAAAAAAWYLAQAHDTAESPKPVRSDPGKTTGTIKFVVVPGDSTIAITGKPMHTGSPWTIDLDPGVHQTEIHHDGYKAWLTAIDVAAGETLTFRVVLEPVNMRKQM
jgi:serine/threonine protein kinase